jgi:hypothetical protein
MMRPKLVMIEGLPGFGKSTTAKLVHEILAEMSIKSQLFLEGYPEHPADYDGVACLNNDEFDKLLRIHDKFSDLLNQNMIKYGNHYLIEYRKMNNEFGSSIPDEWLDAVAQKDIYELPLDLNRKLITGKWKKFTESVLKETDTFIFDCCFIQNPVTMGMIKYDSNKEDVISYVLELAAITERLNPLLIYVEQNDPEYSFRKAVRERPKEWSEGFIDYYTNQGYGRNQGYKGLEGTLQVLHARRELENGIFNRLKIAKKKVDNSSYNKKDYKELLAGILTGYFR